MKAFAVLFSALTLFACASNGSRATTNTEREPNTVDVAAKAPEPEATPAKRAGEPSNVMEFFEALPEKYFLLESCERSTDKDCSKARADYLKNYTDVSDTKNGYFKGGCDGAQSCIKMAIFKRPDGSYLVGVHTENEMITNFHFLDYAGGAWRDASNEVPEFSKRNWYELPRVGTKMYVFENRVIEKVDDIEVTEKGRKLYDLVWKEGKFSRK